MSNIALAALFGVFHQGGVVPSLFRIHDIIYDSASGVAVQDYRIAYWKTYMPPRHLLAVRQSGQISRTSCLIIVSHTYP